MINKEECLLLGKIAKPHGIKGALLIWLSGIKAEETGIKESVFVEIDGLLVPFFIEEIRKNGTDALILKFEGVNSEIKAKAFAGYAIYILPQQVVKRKSGSKLSGIQGFKVIDVTLGFVGTAVKISDASINPLLHVIHEAREYLIPVHEDIILEINNKTREIRVDAPEGLFDL